MSQKLSVEGLGSPPETSNLRFSIYDLRSVKKDIANVFDAAEHGDSRAIMKFSKAKHFNVDAKVCNDLAYLHIHNVLITKLLRSNIDTNFSLFYSHESTI